MTGAERFRVNSPKVTHETVDDEVVIINLDSGSYYSMSGIGAAIWSLIDSGASIDEAAAHAAGRYAGEAESIRAGLIALVKDGAGRGNGVRRRGPSGVCRAYPAEVY
jgi:hypothetical protein